jgi:hypothetical protein
MGKISSKSKGLRGEHQVIKLIQPVVDDVYLAKGLRPPEIERNLMQSKKGGHDLIGIAWLALEVKYREQTQLAEWWQQTKTQAGEDMEPVLIHRKNNAKWQVRMYGYLLTGSQRIKCPVDISLEAFLTYLRTRLINELN